MAIQITRPGKDFKVTIDGTTFTVRRIPVEEDARLHKEFTKQGELDTLSYAVAELQLLL